MCSAIPSLCFSPYLPLSSTHHLSPSHLFLSLLYSPVLLCLNPLPTIFSLALLFPQMCRVSPVQIPSFSLRLTSSIVFHFDLKTWGRHSNRRHFQSLSFDSLQNYHICIAVIFFSAKSLSKPCWAGSIHQMKEGCSSLAFQHCVDSSSCMQCFLSITFCYQEGSVNMVQRRQKGLLIVVVMELSLYII